MFFELEPAHGLLYGAFVHRTRRGQAAGGVRFWRYDTVEDYIARCPVFGNVGDLGFDKVDILIGLHLLLKVLEPVYAADIDVPT